MNRTWVLLLYALPAGRSRQRVDVWRRLRRLGSLPLNTSAHLLPDLLACLEQFQWLAKRILDEGGDATVSRVMMIEGVTADQLVERFNKLRNSDYAGLVKQLSALRGRRGPSEKVASAVERCRRQFDQIQAMDHFKAAKGVEAAELLEFLERRNSDAWKPLRPSPVANRADFQRKIWCTRPRPGIDRSASAWLINRFIDPQARFVFAEQPPRGAITYDMLEATFTHEGDHCTFETLCERFAIEDKAVRRIGEMVHDADLEDGKFGRVEAIGIDRMLRGLALAAKSDQEILAAGIMAIEALHEQSKQDPP